MVTFFRCKVECSAGYIRVLSAYVYSQRTFCNYAIITQQTWSIVIMACFSLNCYVEL